MRMTSHSRIRRHIAIIGIFLIIAAIITGIPGSYGVGGDTRTLSDNLEIRTWYDLDAVRDNLDGDHILMNDLDSTSPGYGELASPTANQGKGWEPIGFVTNFTPDDSTPTPGIGCSEPVLADEEYPWHGLTGSFDGQGYEILDLFINRPDDSHIGLFLINWGFINDVGVGNATVVGEYWVGSLAGENIGIVSNYYSTGNVSGYNNVGGLVGENSGTVSNSYSTGNVSGNGGVGGMVGLNYMGNVSNSYSTCNVTGEDSVGGLVGQNLYGIVSNSFWDTQTSGQATSDGGTGRNTAEMQNIATFSGAGWDIIEVSLNETNPAYIWNIVNGVTYPFLSRQS
jgi:hypothetical protein